jgi:hypothetical protein
MYACIYVCMSLLPDTCHMSSSSHLLWYHHPSNVWWGIWTLILLTVHFAVRLVTYLLGWNAFLSTVFSSTVWETQMSLTQSHIKTTLLFCHCHNLTESTPGTITHTRHPQIIADLVLRSVQLLFLRDRSPDSLTLLVFLSLRPFTRIQTVSITCQIASHSLPNLPITNVFSDRIIVKVQCMKTRLSNDAALLVLSYLNWSSNLFKQYIYKFNSYVIGKSVLSLRRQIEQLDQGQNHVRTIAQSIKRPSLTAEALFRFQAKVALMQFFKPPNTNFFPLLNVVWSILCVPFIYCLQKWTASLNNAHYKECSGDRAKLIDFFCLQNANFCNITGCSICIK